MYNMPCMHILIYIYIPTLSHTHTCRNRHISFIKPYLYQSTAAQTARKSPIYRLPTQTPHIESLYIESLIRVPKYGFPI